MDEHDKHKMHEMISEARRVAMARAREIFELDDDELSDCDTHELEKIMRVMCHARSLEKDMQDAK